MTAQGDDRLRWFREARFGMVIHWGLYSIPARGEWVMYTERIPYREYSQLAGQFNPRRYDADEWAGLAKQAGMKYMVLTTRHHDGFSLFDSKVSDYTSAKTAAGRDLVAEYADACRRAGLRLGFYYSLKDWHRPAYMAGPQADPGGWAELVDYVHAQVRELCTRYGKLDIMWYDGPGPYIAEGWRVDDIPSIWRAQEMNAMVRELQPGIIINDRSILPEDFDTPEQHITPSNRMWESCMTINDHWGYAERDDNWKPAKDLVRNLVQCVSGGGNYLLNVGPDRDGVIPAPSVQRLQEMGRWLESNGESIYGAGRCPMTWTTVGLLTARGSRVYVHCFYWPGSEITIGGFANRVERAYFLATGEAIDLEQRRDRLFLRNLPDRAPDPIDTVIVLEMDGEPRTATDQSMVLAP